METSNSTEKKPASNTSASKSNTKVATTSNSKADAKPPEKRDPIKEICIEVCQNCQTHKWCTRHDDKKYNGLFEEVKTAIQSAIGGEIQVVKNLNVKQPRIGAFEVTCNDLVVFSKIKSGLFPVPSALAQRVKLFLADYNSGNDVGKYSSIEEKKYSPPKKKIAQTSLDWNAKYEELKKSQVKQKENQNNQSQQPVQENEKEMNQEKEHEHEKEKEHAKEMPKEHHEEQNNHAPIEEHHEEKPKEQEKKEMQKQPSQIQNDPKQDSTNL